MARYPVVHTCGHAGVVTTSSVQYRERLLARAAALLCPDCFQVLATERAKCRADEAKLQGFAALRGSEAQVRWAEDIRAKKLQALEHRAQVLETSDWWKATDPEEATRLRDCVAQLGQIFEAAWWIRHREYDFADRTLRELALGRRRGK